MVRFQPKKLPVGKNTLATILKRGLAVARGTGEAAVKLLEGVTMTNHSARVTTVTRLRDAGHDEASIMAQTGHRSAAGLKPYMRENRASAIARADDLLVTRGRQPVKPSGMSEVNPVGAAAVSEIGRDVEVAAGRANVSVPSTGPIHVSSVGAELASMPAPTITSEVVDRSNQLGVQSNVSGPMPFGGAPQMWGPYCMPAIHIHINK